MFSALTSIYLFVFGINSQNISWFKNTSSHQNNIQQLINGWSECAEWETLSVASEITMFSFGSTNFNNKIPIPLQNNSIYNITALCVTIQVPLNWDNPNTTNSTIDYYIARLFSAFDPNNTKGSGAFWMLQGGPGYSGSTLYPIGIPVMNFFDDTFDLYIPDHRGTGHSTYLDCNDTSHKSCANDLNKTISDTSYFSTYAASMDLGYAVDLFQSNLPVYNNTNHIIYGASYGTYYLNQYLILFPDQFNASIFDSIASPDMRFSQYGNNSNKVGLLFLQRCHQNIFCNKMFAELNTTILDAINNSFSTLNCLTDETHGTIIMIIRNMLRSWLTSMLQNVYKRVLIPPLLYRMIRCNKDDKKAIDNFILYSTTNPTDISNVTDQYSNSPAVYNNIVYSEMWDGFNTSDPGPTYEELIEFESTSYFSTVTSATRKAWDDWNIRYTPKPIVFYQYADPPNPMLLLGGDIDPQTHIKYGLRSARHYGASIDNISITNNRYFFTFRNAPHGTIITSLIQNYTDSRFNTLETCALYVIKSFINPNGNYIPNTDCFAWLSDIDWNATSNISKELGLAVFGTTDVWGTQSIETSDVPTQSPLPGNLTHSPTESPAVLPTEAMSKAEKAWFITGIVFICLFVVALMVIGYLVYVLKYSNQNKVSDSQGTYTKANNTDVEVGALKTAVAEDSD